MLPESLLEERRGRAVSLRAKAALALLEVTRRLGHSISSPQWFEAWRVSVETGTKAQFNGIAGALVTEGIAVPVGGRRGTTQYVHRDHAVPLQPVEDLALTVYSVVSALVDECHRPVSTSEVTLGMRARGHVIQANDIYVALVSLTRVSFVPGVGEPRRALVLRIVGHRVAGRRALYWVPVGTQYVTQNPLTGDHAARHGQSDVVRQAIGLVQRVLMRPVSRRDLMLWYRVHKSTHPVAKVLDPTRLGKTLQALAKRTNLDSGRDRVLVIRTACAVHGGAPTRYHVGAFYEGFEEGLAGCAVEDAVKLLRVAEEVELLNDLSRRSDLEVRLMSVSREPQSGTLTELLTDVSFSNAGIRKDLYHQSSLTSNERARCLPSHAHLTDDDMSVETCIVRARQELIPHAVMSTLGIDSNIGTVALERTLRARKTWVQAYDAQARPSIRMSSRA